MMWSNLPVLVAPGAVSSWLTAPSFEDLRPFCIQNLLKNVMGLHKLGPEIEAKET